MNKIMFDILILLEEGEKWDIKKYAQKLYKPYSVVEQEYKSLIHDGYLNNDMLLLLHLEAVE